MLLDEQDLRHCCKGSEFKSWSIQAIRRYTFSARHVVLPNECQDGMLLWYASLIGSLDRQRSPVSLPSSRLNIPSGLNVAQLGLRIRLTWESATWMREWLSLTSISPADMRLRQGSAQHPIGTLPASSRPLLFSSTAESCQRKAFLFPERRLLRSRTFLNQQERFEYNLKGMCLATTWISDVVHWTDNFGSTSGRRWSYFSIFRSLLRIYFSCTSTTSGFLWTYLARKSDRQMWLLRFVVVDIPYQEKDSIYS